MTTLILTRFLFNKDEVELSLLTALLKKADLQIIYYWAYELYYSGFDIFAFLWKIYLDFYYELQPYFEVYFKKKYSLWMEDKAMVHIAYILRNMYNLTPNGMVFMMRQYMEKDVQSEEFYPTIWYKFKNNTVPVWLQSYDSQYHRLLYAVKQKHYENICYYLKLLEKTQSQVAIATQVCRFLQGARAKDMAMAKDMAKEINNNMHYLLAFIVRKLTVEEEEEVPKHVRVYVAPKQEHLDQLLSIAEEPVPLTKYGLPQIYNTLMHKRFVGIDASIGAFKLARWQWATHEAFVRELYFHWEYYAMGSPVWWHRLQAFGGTINHNSRLIEFASEEDAEGFYNLYAYELDELPQEVQELSMKPLNKTDGRLWHKAIFDTGIDLERLTLEAQAQAQAQAEDPALEKVLEALTLKEQDKFWRWTY